MSLATLKPRSKQRTKDAISGYLFILPGMIGFAIFVLYPFLSSIYYSMTEWNGATEPKFIGLENFRFIFTQDPVFVASIKATAIWVILSVPSGVLAAVGLANQFLSLLGLPSSLWLGDVNLVFPALILISLWSAGGAMVIFLAGLQAVPTELYEAAKLDGASDTHLFWHITIPMISPVILLQTITGSIAAMQSINQPWLVTGGGPDLSTNFLMWKIFTSAFRDNQFGYAVALVWVLMLIILVVTALTFKLSSAWMYAEEGTE